ncbi:MAG: urea ABC transporter permease subunit UrtB [Hyphomicrobiaceae bacterium]|nr:MAG: urea ABC transporter permease subunit UrtB [Hyphomicrobiaceae bacterium]
MRLAPAILAILLAFALPARADKLEDALKRFAEDSYSETIAAIDAISRSGAPTAAAILEALADSRLFVAADKTVFYTDAGGKVYEAKTGRAVADAPPGLEPVRLNNRVRSAVQAALGSLGILSADPAKRRASAAALLKSRDASSLATLESAIGKETDSSLRSLMQGARAAIILAKPDASSKDRAEAIDALAARGDQESLGILKSLPGNFDPDLRAAAERAVSSIESRLALWEVGQNVWYGVSLGSVLLLAAIGLAITFGVMGVINMAHGEMVMIGAYATYAVQEVMRSHAPGLLDYSLFVAVPLAFLAAAAIGLLIERCVIRYLYGRPLETLLATFGVSLILQQAVRSAFGTTNKEVSAPSFMSGAFELGGLSITHGRLWIVVFAILVFLALQLVLRATPFGLQMRAVTQNRRMAGSMGIRTRRVDAMAFAVGSGIAGIAGVALSQIDNVSPNLGQSYIIDSFLVVVFGGVGNLWGTLVGALSLGIANKFLEPYAGAVLGKILLLVLIILFIQKRPRGLFALKGRAVEA